MADVLGPTGWASHKTSAHYTRKYQGSSPTIIWQDVSSFDPDADHNTNTNTSHSSRIKPYLRRLSFRDSANALDLSCPSAENKGLAGLGLLDESRLVSELTYNPNSSTLGSRHGRSASNTSTFSNTSTHHRSSATCVHPFRHTPRPYSSPVARALTAPSSLVSDAFPETDDRYLHEFCPHQQPMAPTSLTASIHSVVIEPSNMDMHSTSSLARLQFSSPSQSSLPSTPTSRSRGDTIRSMDTVQTSARTSMDKALSFIRASVSQEDVDVVTRSAQIAAARHAYTAREEAKERKHEKAFLKQQVRANRKLQHKEERVRRKSETILSPSLQSERPETVGKAYSEYSPAYTAALPRHVSAQQITSGTVESKLSEVDRSFKNIWLGFLAWFRTRLLRISRRLRKSM